MSAEATVSEAAPHGASGPALVGHDLILDGLWRAARDGRLPHALLFHGPSGVGKFAAARLFAMGLYCERGVPAEGRRPCGACSACKRIASGNHPDLFVVDVQAEAEPQELIHISRFVRRDDPKYKGPNVEDFLELRALEGGRRAVLVREMERARDSNGAVQNSILKMLEEPGRDVVWLLECSQPDALLPTIKSRCVPIRFGPLAGSDVAGVLRTVAGVEAPDDELHALARWSHGSPGEALRLRARGAAGQRALLVAVLEGARDPLEASELVWTVEGDFPGRTATAEARERARFVVGLALTLLRDAERARVGVDPATLAHGELFEPRPAWLGSEALMRWRIDELLSVSGSVELNLDPRTAVDRALLALSNRTPGPAPGTSTLGRGVT